MTHAHVGLGKNIKIAMVGNLKSDCNLFENKLNRGVSQEMKINDY